jgi:hypothetical protein
MPQLAVMVERSAAAVETRGSAPKETSREGHRWSQGALSLDLLDGSPLKSVGCTVSFHGHLENRPRTLLTARPVLALRSLRLIGSVSVIFPRSTAHAHLSRLYCKHCNVPRSVGTRMGELRARWAIARR